MYATAREHDLMLNLNIHHGEGVYNERNCCHQTPPRGRSRNVNMKDPPHDGKRIARTECNTTGVMYIHQIEAWR